jgi:hypothetical protein
MVDRIQLCSCFSEPWPYRPALTKAFCVCGMAVDVRPSYNARGAYIYNST